MNEITEKAPMQIWLHEIQWINSGQVETVWRDRRNAPGDVAYVRTDLFNSVSKEILTATNELEAAQKRIAELEADAMRYRFLRDNKHLDKWWSVAGPSDRCENIDADIDEAMKGQ